MKKIFILITILMMCVLISCETANCEKQSNEESSKDASIHVESVTDYESGSVDDNENDTSSNQICLNDYNPYYLLPENDPFIVAMKENPIDKYAEEVMKNNETTQDMMSGLYLVFDEWEKELHATEAKLKETIEDKTLKEAFITSQESWTEYVNTSLACDKELITKNGWSTDIPLMFLSKRIEIYRERTFHLKYLMYLYSIDADDGVVEEAMTFYTCR